MSNAKEGRKRKKNEEQMGQIVHKENAQQDGKLKLNYINNYIKYKWSALSGFQQIGL